MTVMTVIPDRATDPDVAATVRLLHRRHGWSRTAVTSFLAFLLAYGADADAGAGASAQSQVATPSSEGGGQPNVTILKRL